MKWIVSNLAVIHLELRSNWLHFDDQRLEIKVTVNTKKTWSSCCKREITGTSAVWLYLLLCYNCLLGTHKHTFVHISSIQTRTVTKCHKRTVSLWHHMFDKDTFYQWDRKEGKWWSYFACETFLDSPSSCHFFASSIDISAEKNCNASN